MRSPWWLVCWRLALLPFAAVFIVTAAFAVIAYCLTFRAMGHNLAAGEVFDDFFK